MKSRVNLQLDIDHTNNLPTAKELAAFVRSSLWDDLFELSGAKDYDLDVNAKVISAVMQRKDIVSTISEGEIEVEL